MNPASLLAALPLFGGPHQEEPAPPPTIAFEDGLWFDGEGFVPGTRYAVDGLLQKAAPAEVALRIDLGGQWVVPPYGDAHTHFLEPKLVREYDDLFLRRGVFYVRDQGNALGIRRRFDEGLNRPNTIEFVSPNQGFTGPGGHPLQILQRVQSFGIFPADWTPADFHGEAIFIVSDEAGVGEAWPVLLEGKPDFVKVFLLYSERHAERRGRPEYQYRRGLDPRLVPGIVERAHADGLEVSAHVYSRADFRTAVDAGVDLIAHFPGIGYEPELGDPHFLLTAEDAVAAGDAGVSVVTTLSDMLGLPGPIQPGTRAFVDRIIIPNLSLLLEQGVPILLGSDRPRMTTAVEAEALAALELFDPRTLLEMWCHDTPRSIYPERKIGRLADGYEASFLVLEGDPLEDFANTGRIALRVKQGHLLFPPEPAFPPMGGGR